MNVVYENTFKGFIGIKKWEDNIEMTHGEIRYDLIRTISEDVPDELKIIGKEEYEDWTFYMNDIIKNVSISLHISDTEITIEEANENQILLSMGELNLGGSYYGYSEWTIEGLSLDKFMLIGNGGEHDLYEIIKGYEGKYMILDIKIYR